MVDSGMWVPPEKRHRFADVYSENPSKKPGDALVNVSKQAGQLDYIGETPPVFSSGGGGLVATMYDYGEFRILTSNLADACDLWACFGRSARDYSAVLPVHCQRRRARWVSDAQREDR